MAVFFDAVTVVGVMGGQVPMGVVGAASRGLEQAIYLRKCKSQGKGSCREGP